MNKSTMKKLMMILLVLSLTLNTLTGFAYTPSFDTEDGLALTEAVVVEANDATTEAETVAEGTDTEETETGQLKVVSTKDLSLRYDDRYSFDADSTLKGYAVVTIKDQNVTSYAVNKGKTSSQKDANVLRSGSDTKYDVIASGVGTATVLLAKAEEVAEARKMLDTSYEAEKDIEVKAVHVTVTPAKLTLLLLTGQSNMEGYCSTSTGYQHKDSIPCKEGQVYSTYLQSAKGASKIAPSGTYTKTDDMATLVAGSLTGTTSVNGTTLKYPLNTLTYVGAGKTGPDSGLAYEWNRLSGDKMWVINAAWGGTKIAQWIPGGSCYKRAYSGFSYVLQTYNAEVAAGHYTKGNRLMFWLQGESDGSAGTDCTTYYNNFLKMYDSFDAQLALDYCGIIVTRSHLGSNTNAEDIKMSGPRQAQYLLAINQKEPEIYMVSNANEQWVTDNGVRNYFKSAYPSGKLTYPLRSGTTLSGLPTKVTDVHSDIHYSQVAHNENGITAANCMYNIVKGTTTSSVSAKWVNTEGNKTTSVAVALGNNVPAYPVVSPLYMSKKVTISADSNYFKQASIAGSYTTTKVGTGNITIKNQSGKALATVKATISTTAKQATVSLSNARTGVKISWQDVTGAKKYTVYRKVSGGSKWTTLGTTTSTSYVDTSAKAATTYLYKVATNSGSYLGSQGTKGYSITRLSQPAISIGSVSSKRADYINVCWKSVSGATSYRVYRKTNGSSWKRIAEVKSGTLFYKDTTVKDGVTYTYTVRALKGSSTSSYNTTGVSAYIMNEPSKVTNLKATKGSKKVTLKWSKVSGADGYAIYRRKKGSSSWTTVTSDTTKTSYTVSNLTAGTTYEFRVRAYKKGSANGTNFKAFSDYSQVVSAKPTK